MLDRLAETFHQTRFAAEVDQHKQRLRRDRRFAAEVRYCYERGVPHSWFMGGDYRWLGSDRDKIVAYQEWVDQICRGCGTHPDDWPEGWEADPPMVAVAHRCPGCFTRETKQAQFEADTKEAPPHVRRGVSLRLRVRTDADDEREAADDARRAAGRPVGP